MPKTMYVSIFGKLVPNADVGLDERTLKLSVPEMQDSFKVIEAVMAFVVAEAGLQCDKPTRYILAQALSLAGARVATIPTELPHDAF